MIRTTSSTGDVFFTEMPSPVGRLTLTWQDEGLTGVLFEGGSEGDGGGAAGGEETRGSRASWIRDDRRLRGARAQLDEYFAGARMAFDLPLVMRGTAFQQRVWRALCRIPFGATASYGDIAARIGSPGASRAVGGANHRNAIAIVVPCHRVIGADGSLTGYGGGESRKRRLLELERRFRDAARTPVSRIAVG